MTAPTPTPEPAPSATPPAEPTPPTPATGDGLGDAGKKALAELRAENKELAKQLKALSDRDPLKAIAEALGAKPGEAKGDDLAATVKQMQEQMQAAELKALRLEVAAEAGLTPAQAKRLTGATREELVADAAELKALFPAPAQPTGPGTPAPDPSQGARGGSQDLHAAIAAAEKAGDFRESIRLKQGLLDAARARQS